MMNKKNGYLAAVAAFAIWGTLPIYLKLISSALPLEILCHRIVWSTAATLLLLTFWGKSPQFFKSLQEKKLIKPFILSAALISVNWLTYIWAVNNDHVVEASLGYYINPLINVLLGVLVLHERLRVLQWTAVFFAFLGVAYLTFFYGHFPWIAIVLGVSFSLYGLLRKTSALPSLEGLCLETMILFLPAFITLAVMAGNGTADFMHQNTSGILLLLGTGIITSVPLLFFGYAAQKIPLSTLGIFQYFAPTLQLCIGIFLYSEPFPTEQKIGFILVWCGLVLYGSESILQEIRRHKQPLTSV